ncbi:MAG: hypothetical protein ACRD1L_07525 [Terriglobales bacterium]
MPSTIWNLLQNPNDLWGAYVFDLWTGNTDTRQYLLSREGGTRPYRVVLFDHGHCFGGPTWRFLDSSVSPDPALLSYARVSGWNDLEPWLMRLESVSPASVAGLREGIPPSWLGATGFRNLGGLLATLIARRAAVRRFVAQRVRGGAQPFSTWRVCRDGHWRPSQWLRHSNVA